MSGRDIPTAPNLRETRELWRGLGGNVEDIRRTGEERYSHRSIERPIRVNKRRKDAPRKLVTALRRIADPSLSRPAGGSGSGGRKSGHR